MHTYFFEGILQGNIILSEAESHHAVKVMRSKNGDEVFLINGIGSKAIGIIENNHPKKCEINIGETFFEAENSPKITIAIAPTKTNERIEFFLEKATEIGVDTIIPLLCDNNERGKVNLERWQKIILAATKQSQRFWMPNIEAPATLQQLISQSLPPVKLIAYCEELPEQSILDFASSKEDKIVLIGPEGDFSKREIEIAEQNDFKKVHLGKNRLRTETAGLVALTHLRKI